MRRMPTSLFRPLRLPGRQQGAVLMMAMMILVLILMAGITATSNSNSQLKLASAFQSEDDALNKAEAALAFAEAWLARDDHHLSAGFAGYDAQATPGLLPIGFAGSVVAAGQVSTAAPGLRWPDTGEAASAVGVDGDPGQQFFIAQRTSASRLPGSSQVTGGRSSVDCDSVNTYQVTARGRDPRGAARVVESQFSVLQCPE